MNDGAVLSVTDRWPHATTFLRHLFEMTVAMMLGMCVLGAAFRGIHVAVFGTGFDDAWHRHVELTAFAMAFNMTLPMVAWMRHRGHGWQRSGEMAAAMFVPALALLALFRLTVISAHVVLPLQMALMLPSMILVMLYRIDEYTRHPHRLVRPLLVEGLDVAALRAGTRVALPPDDDGRLTGAVPSGGMRPWPRRGERRPRLAERRTGRRDSRCASAEGSTETSGG
jgi:hypothetical protein